MMNDLNPIQRRVLEHYCGGEFAYIQSEEQAKGVGDTLLVFLLRELGDGCDDSEAAGRIRMAIRELSDLLDEFAE